MTMTDSQRLEKLALIMDGDSYGCDSLSTAGFITQFPTQVIRIGRGDFTGDDLRRWIDSYTI